VIYRERSRAIAGVRLAGNNGDARTYP